MNVHHDGFQVECRQKLHTLSNYRLHWIHQASVLVLHGLHGNRCSVVFTTAPRAGWEAKVLFWMDLCIIISALHFLIHWSSEVDLGWMSFTAAGQCLHGSLERCGRPCCLSTNFCSMSNESSSSLHRWESNGERFGLHLLRNVDFVIRAWPVGLDIKGRIVPDGQVRGVQYDEACHLPPYSSSAVCSTRQRGSIIGWRCGCVTDVVPSCRLGERFFLFQHGSYSSWRTSWDLYVHQLVTPRLTSM